MACLSIYNMSNQNGGSQQAAIQQLQLENQELRNTISKIQQDQHIMFQSMLTLVNSLNANNNKKNVQETPKVEPNQSAPEKQNLFPPFEIDNMGKPSQSAPETIPLNMPAGNEFQVPQVGQKQSAPKMPQDLDQLSNLMQQQPENKLGIDEEIEGLDFLSLEGDVQKQTEKPTQPQPEEPKQENEVKHNEVSAKPQPETKPVNEGKGGFGNLITRLFSSNRELKNNQKVLGTTAINKQQNGLAQQ